MADDNDMFPDNVPLSFETMFSNIPGVPPMSGEDQPVVKGFPEPAGAGDSNDVIMASHGIELHAPQPTGLEGNSAQQQANDDRDDDASESHSRHTGSTTSRSRGDGSYKYDKAAYSRAHREKRKRELAELRERAATAEHDRRECERLRLLLSARDALVSTQRDELKRLRGMLGLPAEADPEDTHISQITQIPQISHQGSISNSNSNSGGGNGNGNDDGNGGIGGRVVPTTGASPSASSAAALVASLTLQASPPTAGKPGVSTRRSSRRANSPEDAQGRSAGGAGASATAAATNAGGVSFASLAMMGTPGPGSEPYVRDRLRNVYLAILSGRPVESYLEIVREARGLAEDGSAPEPTRQYWESVASYLPFSPETRPALAELAGVVRAQTESREQRLVLLQAQLGSLPLSKMELEAARQVLTGLAGDVGNLIRERDTQSLLLYVVREALAPVQSAQILAVHFDG